MAERVMDVNPYDLNRSDAIQAMARALDDQDLIDHHWSKDRMLVGKLTLSAWIFFLHSQSWKKTRERHE